MVGFQPCHPIPSEQGILWEGSVVHLHADEKECGSSAPYATACKTQPRIAKPRGGKHKGFCKPDAGKQVWLWPETA